MGCVNVDDEVTAVGFTLPMGVQVFVQTGGQPVSDVASTVEATMPVDTLVNVSVHSSEQGLLAGVSGFVEERFCNADILRTQALGRLAERYCSKSDFRLKSLTLDVL